MSSQKLPLTILFIIFFSSNEISPLSIKNETSNHIADNDDIENWINTNRKTYKKSTNIDDDSMLNDAPENTTKSSTKASLSPENQETKVNSQSTTAITQLTNFAFTTKNRRYCTNNDNCMLHLNERCIQHSTYSVCDCKHPFYRSSPAEPCQLLKGAFITLKFNNQTFHQQLLNSNSPEFIQYKDDIENILRRLLQLSPILSSNVASIDLVSFADSPFTSRILIHVKWDLFKENFQVQLAREMTRVFLSSTNTTIINGKNVSNVISSRFNICSIGSSNSIDIQAIEVDINACQWSTLNYCGESSACQRINNSGLGFRCRCYDGYTDQSPLKRIYPGETCAIECPLSYCANSGHCLINLSDSTFYCACIHWNVGNRCQYSGILVFSVLAIVVILLMIIVACTASSFCGKRISKSGFYQRRVSPTYEDTIRPFRIAVNHYDSPDEQQSSVCGEKVIKMTGVENPVEHEHTNLTPNLILNSNDGEKSESFKQLKVDNEMVTANGEASKNSLKCNKQNQQTQVTWF